MPEITVRGEVGGREVTLSSGKLAGQAGGAVTATIGDTQVLVTATSNPEPREGASFFPLTVDVEERMYAAGRIPGSFFRREGRATERAILTCRLIDRPLRPSFPEGFRNDTQVVSTILSVDMENPYDVLSLIGASASLTISPMPFDGPIGAVRVALKDGEWIANPTFDELAESHHVLSFAQLTHLLIERSGRDMLPLSIFDPSGLYFRYPVIRKNNDHVPPISRYRRFGGQMNSPCRLIYP